MLDSVVDSRESLGRYLPEDTYFSPSKNAVKPKAFMPKDLKLSVFRIDGLTLEQIWATGEKEVIQAMPQHKVLHGVGEIIASKVQEMNLIIEPDDLPARHANIVGWPAAKEQQKLIAIELAAEAKLVLRT